MAFPEIKGSPDEENSVSRVFAILIAIPAVEFALFTALSLITGRWYVYSVFFGAPIWFHVLLLVVTASGAYMGGIDGLMSIYHHLTYRHATPRRNPVISGSLWCAPFILAGIMQWLAQ